MLCIFKKTLSLSIVYCKFGHQCEKKKKKLIRGIDWNIKNSCFN